VAALIVVAFAPSVAWRFLTASAGRESCARRVLRSLCGSQRALWPTLGRSRRPPPSRPAPACSASGQGGRCRRGQQPRSLTCRVGGVRLFTCAGLQSVLSCSGARMAPESLSELLPEERHQVYRMLRLRIVVKIDGTLEVSGTLVEGASFCTLEPRSWPHLR
jgi:hypothetical protein